MIYRDDKATQIAAQFLKRANGCMAYSHLLKMVYAADKRSLLQYGEPITFDAWVSMKYGPVPRSTYDAIKKNTLSPYWSSHIQTDGYDVKLISDPGDGALSELEDEIVDEVFSAYGNKDRWEIVELTRDFPEWDKTRAADGGYSEITYKTVLANAGVRKDVIEDILDNIAGQKVCPICLTSPTCQPLLNGSANPHYLAPARYFFPTA